MLAALVLVAVTIARAAGDPPLVDAAKKGDVAAVRALLQKKADVNAQAADGATAMHWAAYRDDLQTADLLAAAGADANVANELGVTPLWLACGNASAPMVQRLLRAGASPRNLAARISPLLRCAQTGNEATVAALLAAKAEINAREPLRGQTALMWAAAQDHPAIVRLLLKNGADVNARSQVTRLVVNRANPNDIYTAIVGEVSRGGSTPLLFAARSGGVETAAALLDAAANVNEPAPDGTTPLIVAAMSGHGPLGALLLERGANPNIISPGYTALHAAVLRGDAALVRALLARGAGVNSRVRNGTATTRGTHDYFLPESVAGATPFWLAARYLEIDIMKALADKGADIKLALPDGTTPLMAAAGVPAVPPLFDRRERLAVLRNEDEPVALAAVTLALDLGADVNAANATGDTALHGAAMQNYPAVAQLLLKRGARPNAVNRAGKAPLEVANGQEVRTVLLRAAQ